MKTKRKLTKALLFMALVMVCMPFTTKAAGYAGFMPKSQGGTYNYCPAIMREGNYDYIYYCCNASTPGTIIDNICLKTRDVATGNKYSGQTIVLKPSAGKWDSYHVCDPSVIRGKFKFNGGTYNYLMAFLGCSNGNNNNNSIGLAVSNDGRNWIKVNVNSPLIRYEENGGWGCGQPSLIKVGSQYVIAYTSATKTLTCTKIAYLTNDLKVGKIFKVSNTGTKQSVGANGKTPQDFISNADFAMYDGYMYMICDQHVDYMFPYSKSSHNVPKNSIIYKTKCSSVADLQKCTWTKVDELTGVGEFRCHNACFFRDVNGNWISGKVGYSEAHETGDYLTCLWSYNVCFANTKK